MAVEGAEMRTISGLYDTFDQARLAVEELEDSGVSSRDISIVAPAGIGPGEAQDMGGTVAGASVGAAVGGVGGLLAGFGPLLFPGSARWSGLVGWRPPWWERSREVQSAAFWDL
jgi:hypothetical protein